MEFFSIYLTELSGSRHEDSTYLVHNDDSSWIIFLSHRIIRIPAWEFLPFSSQWWLIVDFLSHTELSRSWHEDSAYSVHNDDSSWIIFLSLRIVRIPAWEFRPFSSKWWLIMDYFSLSQNCPDPGMRVPPIQFDNSEFFGFRWEIRFVNRTVCVWPILKVDFYCIIMQPVSRPIRTHTKSRLR